MLFLGAVRVVDDEEKAESIRRALGEPVLASFSEELRLTKRNLLFVSSSVIFAKVSGMTIGNENVSLIGLSFSNPGPFWLDVMLLGVTAYLLVQFIWQSWDYGLHTRIRATGTKVRWVTVGKSGHSGADYPEDAQQSSLYNWWVDQASKIKSISSTVAKLEETAERLKISAESTDPGKGLNYNNLIRQSAELKSHAHQLREQLYAVEKVIGSERISISLERFDDWFWGFSSSQTARLILLDELFPLCLGFGAVIVVSWPYFSSMFAS